MKWDKYTVLSQEAFQLAQQKAEELGHQELRPDHLLLAFLRFLGKHIFLLHISAPPFIGILPL